MTDKCKRCGREKFETVFDYEADFYALQDKCGAHLGSRDAHDDCRSRQLHVVKLRLIRAETLLNSASMTHFMGKEYQDKLASEINEFLAEGRVAK